MPAYVVQDGPAHEGVNPVNWDMIPYDSNPKMIFDEVKKAKTREMKIK